MAISLSTAADQVGAACGVLKPLLDRLAAHVLAAERLHGDDTMVPVLAKGKTDTGRLRVHVRDGRPFGGAVPLLPRPRRRASRSASGRLDRSAAGRRLCQEQPPLRGRPHAGARGRFPVLDALSEVRFYPERSAGGADVVGDGGPSDAT